MTLGSESGENITVQGSLTHPIAGKHLNQISFEFLPPFLSVLFGLRLTHKEFTPHCALVGNDLHRILLYHL